jgi:hypothetical protein
MEKDRGDSEDSKDPGFGSYDGMVMVVVIVIQVTVKAEDGGL